MTRTTLRLLGKFMRRRRAWKRGSGRRSTWAELVVRREADLTANLVELARLAEYPAQPRRRGERAHRHHQKRVAILNGARGLPWLWGRALQGTPRQEKVARSGKVARAVVRPTANPLGWVTVDAHESAPPTH